MTANERVHVVYVSIGSNIRREENVRACLAALVAAFGAVAASSVYESDAVGHPGRPYYNLAARFETSHSLARVSGILHAIEEAQGRERGVERFVDRTLDVDLLLFDDLSGEFDAVVLPRREIMKHAFVTGPLAEIAPETRIPGDGRRVAEIWDEMVDGGATLRPVRFDWFGVELPAVLTR